MRCWSRVQGGKWVWALPHVTRLDPGRGPSRAGDGRAGPWMWAAVWCSGPLSNWWDFTRQPTHPMWAEVQKPEARWQCGTEVKDMGSALSGTWVWVPETCSLQAVQPQTSSLAPICLGFPIDKQREVIGALGLWQRWTDKALSSTPDAKPRSPAVSSKYQKQPGNRGAAGIEERPGQRNWTSLYGKGSWFLSKAVMSRFVFQKKIVVLGKEKGWKPRMEEGVPWEMVPWLVHFTCRSVSSCVTGSLMAVPHPHPPSSRGIQGWYSAGSTTDWSDEWMNGWNCAPQAWL